MRQSVRKLQQKRRRFKEGPFPYIVTVVDCLFLGVIVGGLYWLTSAPDEDQLSEANLSEKNKRPFLIAPDSVDAEASSQTHILSERQTNQSSGENNTLNASESGTYEIANSDAPFRFYKVDSTGQVISQDALNWQCILDRSNGLYWEVKQNDGGWQDREHTYTWFYVDENGQHTGKADGGSCLFLACDTQSYIDHLNQKRVCGFSDWRLPEQKELASLDHESRYFPDIDVAYFPHTQSGQYWSNTGNPYTETLAWSVDFNNGISYVSEKRLSYYVRGVRGDK